MAQLGGSTKDNTTGNLTSLASFHSVTDHTEWMSELARHGNKPSEWLDYLSLIEAHTVNAEETSRYRFLSQAYNRATKQIPIDKYCGDPAYARILIKLAQLKATNDVDEGRMIFKFARANIRKQAIVHLEAAKFEEIHGDTKKCMSILEKGMKITSDARLPEALHRVKNGLPILLDCEEPMESQGPQQMTTTALVSAQAQPIHSDKEKQSSHVPCTMEYVDTTVSFRRPEIGSRNTTQSKSDTSDHEGDTVPISGGTRFSGLQTPDTANKLSVFGSSRRKRCGNIGMPLRVNRTSLPISKKDSHDDDDDDDDDYDIRPLKTSPQDNRPLAPITEKTNESDSGVQTTPTDITLPDEDRFTTKARAVGLDAEPTVPGSWSSSVQKQNPPMPAQQIGHQQLPRQLPHHTPHWLQQQQPVPQKAMPHAEQPPLQAVQQQLFQQPTPAAAVQPSHQVAAPQMVPRPSQAKKKNRMEVNGKAYSIIKLIGKGGSSRVYQVISEDTQKLLALKYVKLDFADEFAMQSYMNEITLLERLKSFKRIIHLYDYEITENYIYLVMECGSIDLATFLKKNKDSFSPYHMWCYWKEMLEAVDVIHKEGIVHSDLKPANFIFVEASLKLIDFGIANAIQNDSTSVVKESQVGTLNYMSPEAIQDTSPVPEVNESGRKKPRLKINCKSDVWSLGCILYSMVYGRTPFQHIVHGMLKMHAICNPDHQIDFPPIENELLLDVMKKCLTRDVKKRPSIQELLNHPYVKQPFTAAVEKPATTLTTEHISALVSQLSQSQINSPRSIARLAQGVVEQINRGQQIDVSSAVKGSAPHQVPGFDGQMMPPAPQQYHHHQQQPLQQHPQQQQNHNPQPHHLHTRPHHQPVMVPGQEGAHRSQRAPLRVINSSGVGGMHQAVLKPHSLSSKYDIGSSQENEQMNT